MSAAQFEVQQTAAGLAWALSLQALGPESCLETVG